MDHGIIGTDLLNFGINIGLGTGCVAERRVGVVGIGGTAGGANAVGAAGSAGAAAAANAAGAANTASAAGFWDVVTGHSYIVIYIAVLLVLIIAAMVLIIWRSGSEAKAAEAERKKRRNKKRFSRLYALDESAKKAPPEVEFSGSLGELCDSFRNYAASAMGLYYDAKTVRAFVSALSVTRLIILEGISGTGKTSLPYAFGKFVKNPPVIVPVQPSWKDKTDLLGYYNEFTDSFTETELLVKLYEANCHSGIFMTVLDEMNIARVEYYFAEFLSLLELPDPASRRIEVVSSRRDSDPELLKDGKLLIPENMWFAGTANNDDSTLSISDKVYDRAMVLELDSRGRPFNAPKTGAAYLSAAALEKLFARARAAYALSGQMRLCIEKLDAFLTGELGITFGNRIMRQTENFVPVYIAAGGTEADAVDLILCKKVLRKLENRNPLTVGAKAEALLAKLTECFGAGAMPLCRAYVAGFIRN